MTEMDLIVLNDDNQPEEYIDNYNSLIWTERYAPYGDFELITGDIERTMALLYDISDPEKEINVTVDGSRVTMNAEVFLIEHKKNQGRTLKVTGRSFDNVFERRGVASVVASGSNVNADWFIPAVKPSDAAYLLLRYILGDSGRTVNGVTLPSVAPLLAPEDEIPEVELIPPTDFGYIPQSDPQILPSAWVSGTTYVRDSYVVRGAYDHVTDGSPEFMDGAAKIYRSLMDVTSSTEPKDDPANWVLMSFQIPLGQLDTAFLDLVNMNYHGVRTNRPVPGDSKVGIEIYNGADKRDTVIFDVKQDQVEDSTYLMSQQGSANTAYVYTQTKSETINKTTTTKSGLRRRVLVVDLTAENVEDLRNPGLIELYKYNATAMFDGRVAETVAEGYNQEDGYFLGDIVRLVGDFGLERFVRVSEFIRTSDSTGYRAYPTLEVIEE